MYEDAVKYEGLSSSGQPSFVMLLSCPDPVPYDDDATVRQRASIEKFYCFTPSDDFKHKQAHAMLCARNYAIEFTKITAPHLGNATKTMFERLTAAYILSNNKALHSIIYWSEKLYEQGDDFYIAAKRNPFDEVFMFQHFLFKCIFEGGCTVGELG